MPVAVHLFLIKDNNILLLRRYNTGYEDGNYSVVAGHLDGDENIKTAIIREAQEEAGILLLEKDIEVVGVIHKKTNYEIVDFFVFASIWQGEIKNLEPNKCDELAWFDINKLPSNTILYIRKAIENYKNGMWFDSLGW